MATFPKTWADEHLCGGKNKYSKREAEHMKGVIGRGRKKSMRVYECRSCGYWHLTKRDTRY